MLDFERQFTRQIFTNKCGVNSLNNIRYFGQWKKSQFGNSSPVIDRRPWMTFQSISVLEKEINNGNAVFEYGGGGSTLFFLDRGAIVTTVEHDKEWFEKLFKIISNDNLTKFWTGIYRAPEDEVSPCNLCHSSPESYKSSSQNFIGKTFKKYVDSINEFPDKYFDFVIIDGRARPSCVKQSVAKVKVGGRIVLDNTERDYYLTTETLTYLGNFELELDKIGPSPYVNFFTKTNIWKRLY